MTRAHALTASAATADRARDQKCYAFLAGVLAVFVIAWVLS